MSEKAHKTALEVKWLVKSQIDYEQQSIDTN